MMRHRFNAPLSNLSLGLILIASSVTAADWPRWLGPNGDNIAPDDGRFVPDLAKWNVAWKATVGRGYSVLTIADGRAFTLGHDEKSQETVFCLDATSGKELWKFSYSAELLPKMHPGGPHASPTVVGNRVLTVSKDGQVFCFMADKGGKLWQAKLTEVMGIKVPDWGFASTPVVHNGQVLLSAGKVATLDLETGKTVWTSKAELHPGYATPVVFTFGGREFIASLDGKGLAVFSRTDGAEISRSPFKALYDMTATTPIVLANGSRILISANLTGEMLSFDGKKLSSLWTTRDLKNNMNNCVVLDGVLYGIDGKENYNQGRFVAVNVADGKLKWAKENFGYGTVIGVGKTLLALNESGELVTIQPSPAAYRELSRKQILGKTCWTNPVYANGRIYVRNDRGDVQCLATK